MGLDLERWIDVSRAACALAAALAALAWVARSPRALRLAAATALVATCAAAAALVRLGTLQKAVPLLQPADVGLAAGAILLAVAAAVAWRAGPHGLRARVITLALALLFAVVAAGLFAEGHSSVTERPPALRSAWLPVHAGAWGVALALALLALAARVAARGRDLGLNRFAERSAGVAFAAATLGFVSGCAWSLQAWASLWAWDTKNILALLAWLGLALFALAPELPPRVAARSGLGLAAAVVVMLVSLYGLRFVPSAYTNSMHLSYPDPAYWRGSTAQAEPLPEPPPALRLRLEDGPESFPLSSK